MNEPCTCPGIVEDLNIEIRRLERLLETERICHRQTKAKLEKAVHDRDRYHTRLKKYEEWRRLMKEANVRKDICTWLEKTVTLFLDCPD